MKVLIKSAWGSADPTQATFPFHHANAFAEAGHQVQVFLLGEPVNPMRPAGAGAVVPVGRAPLAGALPKLIEHRVPIHGRGAFPRPRGGLSADREGKTAAFAHP